MKVLKEGTPIILHGECPACHTTVETDTKEARKYQVPLQYTGNLKVHFEVTCPTCATPFEVMWRGPGCPDRVERKALGGDKFLTRLRAYPTWLRGRALYERL